MSLQLAELFIILADTNQKIADLLVEDSEFPHTDKLANDCTSDELAEAAEAAVKKEAATKKAAAAKKRREAAKKKKEDKAAATAAADDDAAAEDVDLDELLEKAQAATRAYLKISDPDSTRAILKTFGVKRCGDAEGDAEKLAGLINAFAEASDAEGDLV